MNTLKNNPEIHTTCLKKKTKPNKATAKPQTNKKKTPNNPKQKQKTKILQYREINKVVQFALAKNPVSLDLESIIWAGTHNTKRSTELETERNPTKCVAHKDIANQTLPPCSAPFSEEMGDSGQWPLTYGTQLESFKDACTSFHQCRLRNTFLQIPQQQQADSRACSKHTNI